MISMVRLEADCKTLAEVIKELDAATKTLGPVLDKLNVHDEHYERVHDTCFKGRRVFRPGQKSVMKVIGGTNVTAGSASGTTLHASFGS